jgi:RNA polymerase sigma-70 factor (ECF subfamily)
MQRGPLPPLREERVTRPRRGARRQPAAEYEPAYPEPELVIAEAWQVREFLRRAGALDADLDDLMQETMTAAVVAVARGRFRPNPTLKPRSALRRWLIGIAFKQLGHLQQRAYRRHEVLSGEAEDFADASRPSLEVRAAAWETLRALAALPPKLRDVIALDALGWTIREIATHLGIPAGTVSTRIRLARRDLARLLRRRGR